MPICNALLQFVAFVVFVVLHEYAHAWTAVRCGDPTPKEQKRLTLDPIAHIDLIGTIILPLLTALMGAAVGQCILFGWGKPVEVNLDNFRHRRRDDILVSAAGPAMNFVIAVVIVAMTKVLDLAGGAAYVDAGLDLARLSLFLCFFNLLPIPPLDGGHIMRNLVGMSDETYAMLSRYSFIFFLMIMRFPAVQVILAVYTKCVLALLIWPFGWSIEI